VSGYSRLIEAVMQRGATDEQIQKLVGQNLLRAWRENELLAVSLQKQKLIKPAEHGWEGRAIEPFDGSLPSHRHANKPD
jgi:membrane dipeptidase